VGVDAREVRDQDLLDAEGAEAGEVHGVGSPQPHGDGSPVRAHLPGEGEELAGRVRQVGLGLVDENQHGSGHGCSVSFGAIR